MPVEDLKIIPCPPQQLAEALALVLSDVAPGQRRAIAGQLLDVNNPTDLTNEPLLVALRNGRLCGAAWGQRQPGHIAVFWPAQLVAGENEITALLLTEACVRVMDETAIELTQALLSSRTAPPIPVLEAIGFTHLADLLYMSCEAGRFTAAAPTSPDLKYLDYNPSRRNRFIEVIGQTYEKSLDCAALNGMRTIENVISGYQDTGVFRPENWLLVQARGQDAGVLLLADHPNAGHWELVYMGLVPGARRQGWGRQIAQYAQWLARVHKVQRIVVAVDAANTPAVRMYRLTGFEIWDRRTVYVRFRPA
jgi:ribosomal protein S18 acetylase RimI-like enzyme